MLGQVVRLEDEFELRGCRTVRAGARRCSCWPCAETQLCLAQRRKHGLLVTMDVWEEFHSGAQDGRDVVTAPRTAVAVHTQIRSDPTIWKYTHAHTPPFDCKYFYVSAFHFGLKDGIIYHSKYAYFASPWQTLPNDYFYQLFQVGEEIIISFKKPKTNLKKKKK